MKTIEYTYDNLTLPTYFKEHFADTKLLFFDIETTGFVAGNTTLYLIGVLWYEQNTQHILQWFNEDGTSEKELLMAFHTFTKQFSHLVHFNGLGFDLPYLRKKAEAWKVPFIADEQMYQIDILKEIRPYKNLFMLQNLKQTSIESFLNIKREDAYSGGELIKVYQRYIARPNATEEQILLLHNHDDLMGMPKISQILNYKAFFEDASILDYSMEKKAHCLEFRLHVSEGCTIPKRISITKNTLYLNAFETSAILQIPYFDEELKHFFSDYKNYYYLPEEDIAIHKSVAAYVDTKRKEKAKKETCYIKKKDLFLPSFLSKESEIFKKSHKEKEQYISIQTLENADSTTLTEYLKTALRTFL